MNDIVELQGMSEEDLIVAYMEIQTKNELLEKKLQEYKDGFWGRTCVRLHKQNEKYKQALTHIAYNDKCLTCPHKEQPKKCKQTECIIYVALKALEHKEG